MPLVTGPAPNASPHKYTSAAGFFISLMTTSLITIDGASHEGGGQILRTALALAVVTGKSFRITRIRGNRAKPGLMRQHLTSVEALAKISGAKTEGAAMGSCELTFTPGAARGGDYRFVVGTAGSTTLVAQATLPALLAADKTSELVIEGGTHNPHAPPFEFFNESFLPVLRALGAEVVAELEEYGFYPAGGGRIRLRVIPWKNRRRLTVQPFEGESALSAFALVSNIPERIGARETQYLLKALPALRPDTVSVVRAPSPGPGNLLAMRLVKGGYTTVISKPGEREIPAALVAKSVIEQTERMIGAPAAICEHLADQLLAPLAMAGGGEFVTAGITPHFEANAAVIRKFFPEIEITHTREARLCHRVFVKKIVNPDRLLVPRG